MSSYKTFFYKTMSFILSNACSPVMLISNIRINILEVV
jgi:hypothetical protein